MAGEATVLNVSGAATQDQAAARSIGFRKAEKCFGTVSS